MKFVQTEPEAIETYCELGDGWAKFAKFKNSPTGCPVGVVI